MVKAFGETLEIALREGVHMRLAAYLLAVQRVAEATSLRGLYPRSLQPSGSQSARGRKPGALLFAAALTKLAPHET